VRFLREGISSELEVSSQQIPVKFFSAPCPMWQQQKFLEVVSTTVCVRVL